MTGEESTVETQQAEQSASETVRQELEEQRPSEEERKRLLRQHEGHQIRRTTSKLTETDELGDGMELEVEKEVLDIYCFTCEEWVGISGVELSGTPRSKADAYWLGGADGELAAARARATEAVADAAGEVIGEHPQIDSAEEAVQFVLDAADAEEFTEVEHAE